MNFIYAPKILQTAHPARVLFNGRVFDFQIAGYRNPREGDSLIFGRADSDLITEAVSGASFLVPAQVIRKHGFMSHDYFLYYEEFDYALRMRQFGIKCICALSSVMYHEREGSRGRDEATLEKVRAYYRTRNKLVFFRRRFPRTEALKCTLTHVRQTLRKIANEDAAGKRIYYSGLWHGLIGRTGKVLSP
jgi:GT2 family glycosyltransferase